MKLTWSDFFSSDVLNLWFFLLNQCFVCLLQTINIQHIQDKFPNRKGGLNDLYDRGPQAAFFLVKFWVRIIHMNCYFTTIRSVLLTPTAFFKHRLSLRHKRDLERTHLTISLPQVATYGKEPCHIVAQHARSLGLKLHLVTTGLIALLQINLAHYYAIILSLNNLDILRVIWKSRAPANLRATNQIRWCLINRMKSKIRFPG